MIALFHVKQQFHSREQDETPRSESAIRKSERAEASVGTHNSSYVVR
jgi:hypothetical protein